MHTRARAGGTYRVRILHVRGYWTSFRVFVLFRLRPFDSRTRTLRFNSKTPSLLTLSERFLDSGEQIVLFYCVPFRSVPLRVLRITVGLGLSFARSRWDPESLLVLQSWEWPMWPRPTLQCKASLDRHSPCPLRPFCSCMVSGCIIPGQHSKSSTSPRVALDQHLCSTRVALILV